MKTNNKLFYQKEFSANISKYAKIGENTKIWHNTQIREKAKIGKECIIGKGVYIDKNTVIGNRVKIQNYASIYSKSIIKDGVFIGPYVCLTNDKYPRAINPNSTLKTESDWSTGKIVIHKGASIGAGTIILPDVEIGEFALVGAGSIVTKNLPPHALTYGTPAKIRGYICKCGNILTKSKTKPKNLLCTDCKKKK